MPLKIENISNLGHGFGFDANSNKIFVPKAITGDEIEVKIVKKTNKFTLGKIVKIIAASDFRKTPPCQYFERCGGCNLQHLKDDFYLDFKKKNITELLERAEINFPGELKIIEIGAHSRRRATFQVNRENELGFFEEESNNLVKIENCLMLEPALENLIKPLQNLLKKLPQNFITQISICKFDNVVDVVFDFKKDDISFSVNEKLIEFARGENIGENIGENAAIGCNINLSYQFKGSIKPIYQSSKPVLKFDDIKIDVPSNIFLQATKKGQEAIVAQIHEFVAKINPDKIADIYSGIGSYSFSLAEKVSKIDAKIDAFEGEEKMVNALNQNAKKNGFGNKIRAFTRDLVTNPLRKEELKNYDLVIMNPPRNGAFALVEKLASSEVKNIIYVSCNPASFAVDAKILIENGFKIEKITIIDQFYYTNHSEIVAILTK